MADPSAHRWTRRAFTLVELLVVMAIIVVLIGITVVALRAIAKDARLSSGVNTVASVLDNARAMAMKRNRSVLVVFRPRLDNNEQYVEAVTCEWTGEAALANVEGSIRVVDRFRPIPDVLIRTLPKGVKVAGPLYGSNEDLYWIPQSHLPEINQTTGLGETRGELVAVLYRPDGSTGTRNSLTDSNRTFVDFDNDGWQDVAGTTIFYSTFSPPAIQASDFNGGYFENRFELEETYVSFAPYLAVYDDAAARELKVADWSVLNNYQAELTGPNGYISRYANRLHFNRYTGVVMR